MKKNIIQICLLVAVFCSASCSDWFDVSPKADVKIEDLFKSEAGFRDVLIGGYSLMSKPSMYGREMTWGFLDVLSLYYPSINNKDHQYYKAMRHLYDEPEVQSVTDAVWVTGYKAISNLNAILKHIDDKQDVFPDKAAYELLKGETLALRAFLHFDLCRLFGPVPSPANNSQQSVPYMSDFTNVAQVPLSMTDMYSALMKDIDEALLLMRDHDLIGPEYAQLYDGNSTKVSRRKKYLNYYSVALLKARIAHYFGDKTAAMEGVKLILPTAQSEIPEPLSLTEKADSKQRLFNSELLFMLDIVDFEDKLSPFCGDKAKESGISGTTQLSFSRVAKEKLYEKAASNDNDFRLQTWFTDMDGRTDMMAKYQGAKTIPMLHLSELYYIAAQCAANNEEALTYLNKIRAHRGLAPVTEDQYETELEKEYLKEFMGEGEIFFYYKRKGSNRMGVFSTKTVTDVSKHYQIPYPLAEMEYGKITF